MPAIGYASKAENGSFKGQLRTLSIRVEITIALNARKANDVQPDYRVLAGDVEIGAGWVRRSAVSGNDYVSLSLAAPDFRTRSSCAPQPLLFFGSLDRGYVRSS